MRSVSHQMNAGKFPVHRDLAGFDFDASCADQHLVKELATLSFTDTAQNAVFIGGPGTGKTHLATAIAVSGIALQGKRVRFYSTVDLVNVLEREKRANRAIRYLSRATNLKSHPTLRSSRISNSRLPESSANSGRSNMPRAASPSRIGAW